VHFGGRHAHGSHDPEWPKRIERTQRHQQAATELRHSREQRPPPRWPHLERFHHAGGALDPASTKPAEQLLRAMAGQQAADHEPHHEPRKISHLWNNPHFPA
jgi:hypothetical protein